MNYLLKNGCIVDVEKRTLIESDILIKNNKIISINKNIQNKKAKTIDVSNKYIIPGLIDAHAHNEMSMLSPISFAELILPKGTTSCIFDCHDLANVIGTKKALLWNIQEFKRTLLKSFFMIPSCVPSSIGLETCYKIQNFNDIKPLFNIKKVIGLAEVMDRFFDRRTDLIKAAQEALKKGLIIDGHAPGISNEKLEKYIKTLGVKTDHEFYDKNEILQKYNIGVNIILRKGITEEPNIKNIWEKINHNSRVMLSTDGCMTADFILRKGHMNFVAREIIREGADPIDAIKAASLNTAINYNLKKIGSIKVGNFSDLVILNNLNKISIEKVIVNGKFINKNIKFKRRKIPTSFFKTIKKQKTKEEDFYFKTKNQKPKIRVITLTKSLVTKESIENLHSFNGRVCSDINKDILKIAVVNRYNRKGNISLGFVKGFGLKSGAVACSAAQDSQNIIAIGINSYNVMLAVNRLIDLQGGVCLYDNQKLINKIQLPIAGIMINKRAIKFADNLIKINTDLKQMGCTLKNPIFDLSLMFTVTSIPHVKITDKGYYNVDEECFMEVEIE